MSYSTGFASHDTLQHYRARGGRNLIIAAALDPRSADNIAGNIVEGFSDLARFVVSYPAQLTPPPDTNSGLLVFQHDVVGATNLYHYHKRVKGDGSTGYFIAEVVAPSFDVSEVLTTAASPYKSISIVANQVIAGALSLQGVLNGGIMQRLPDLSDLQFNQIPGFSQPGESLEMVPTQKGIRAIGIPTSTSTTVVPIPTADVSISKGHVCTATYNIPGEPGWVNPGSFSSKGTKFIPPNCLRKWKLTFQFGTEMTAGVNIIYKIANAAKPDGQYYTLSFMSAQDQSYQYTLVSQGFNPSSPRTWENGTLTEVAIHTTDGSPLLPSHGTAVFFESDEIAEDPYAGPNIVLAYDRVAPNTTIAVDAVSVVYGVPSSTSQRFISTYEQRNHYQGDALVAQTVLNNLKSLGVPVIMPLSQWESHSEEYLSLADRSSPRVATASAWDDLLGAGKSVLQAVTSLPSSFGHIADIAHTAASLAGLASGVSTAPMDGIGYASGREEKYTIVDTSVLPHAPSDALMEAVKKVKTLGTGYAQNSVAVPVPDEMLLIKKALLTQGGVGFTDAFFKKAVQTAALSADDPEAFIRDALSEGAGPKPAAAYSSCVAYFPVIVPARSGSGTTGYLARFMLSPVPIVGYMYTASDDAFAQSKQVSLNISTNLGVEARKHIARAFEFVWNMFADISRQRSARHLYVGVQCGVSQIEGPSLGMAAVALFMGLPSNIAYSGELDPATGMFIGVGDIPKKLKVVTALGLPLVVPGVNRVDPHILPVEREWLVGIQDVVGLLGSAILFTQAQARRGFVFDGATIVTRAEPGKLDPAKAAIAKSLMVAQLLGDVANELSAAQKSALATVSGVAPQEELKRMAAIFAAENKTKTDGLEVRSTALERDRDKDVHRFLENMSAANKRRKARGGLSVEQQDFAVDPSDPTQLANARGLVLGSMLKLAYQSFMAGKNSNALGAYKKLFATVLAENPMDVPAIRAKVRSYGDAAFDTFLGVPPLVSKEKGATLTATQAMIARIKKATRASTLNDSDMSFFDDAPAAPQPRAKAKQPKAPTPGPEPKRKRAATPVRAASDDQGSDMDAEEDLVYE